MSYAIMVIAIVFALTYAAKRFSVILAAAEAGDAAAMAAAASAPTRRLALAVRSFSKGCSCS
jgi:hypothetical protein